MPVYFHSENISFTLKNKKITKKWISDIILDSGYTVGDINIIFTSNDYLLEINRKYLNHNYYTDVITFSYNTEKLISGDIYVSIEQVTLNSRDLGVSSVDELNRVIIHGVLHLLGMDDNSDKDRDKMRSSEDRALDKLKLLKN